MLAGSRCTLEFPQQFGHLVARLAAANAGLVLNPEARGLGKNLFPWGEPETGTDLSSLVRPAKDDLPVQNHYNSKQRRVHRYHRRRGIREFSQLIQRNVGHGAVMIIKSPES